MAFFLNRCLSPSAALLISHSLRMVAGLGLGMAIAYSPAQAVQLDFQGRFQKDNDIYQLILDLSAESKVRFTTSSWARGGLDPVFTLWDSSGRLILLQDDYNPIAIPDLSRLRSFESNGVTYTSGDWDITVETLLAAGQYTVALAQYDNRPRDYLSPDPLIPTCLDPKSTNRCLLSEGFQYDGPTNAFFTQKFSRSRNPAEVCLQFCGSSKRYDPRTPDWQLHLDITSTPPLQTIPESTPSGAVWMGLAGIGLWGWWRSLHHK